MKSFKYLLLVGMALLVFLILKCMPKPASGCPKAPEDFKSFEDNQKDFEDSYHAIPAKFQSAKDSTRINEERYVSNAFDPDTASLRKLSGVEVQLRSQEDSYLLRSKINRLLANMYLVKRTSQYDTILNRLNDAEALMRRNGIKTRIDSIELAEVYNLLGNAYQEVFDLARSLFYLNNSLKLNIKLKRKIEIPTELSNIGLSYHRAGKLDSALMFAEEALCLLESDFFNEREKQQNWNDYLGIKLNYATDLYLAGSIELSKGNAEKSRRSFFSAIDIFKDILVDLTKQEEIGEDVTQQRLIVFYNLLPPLIKLEEPQYSEQALQYIKQAMPAIQNLPKDQNRFWKLTLLAYKAVASAQLENCEAAIDFIEIAKELPRHQTFYLESLVYKACAQHADANKEEEYTRRQLEAVRHSIKKIENSMASKNEQESQLAIRNRFQHYYQDAVSTASKLWEDFGRSEEDFSTALNLAERGKSYALRKKIYENYNLMDFKAIDNKASVDESYGVGDNFSRSLVTDIFLDRHTAIVEYFIGPKDAWVFIMTKEKSNIFKIGNPKVIAPLVKKYRDNIAENAEFRSFSHQLYLTVFKDPHQWLKENASEVDELLIVPDKELYKVSFDGLVSNNTKNQRSRFLLDEYAISYHYSLGTTIANKPKTITTQEYPFLAFAATNRINKTYGSLPQLKELSQKLAEDFKRVPTENLFKYPANTKIFKELAPRAKIILLAMHGFWQPESLQSYLQFAPYHQENSKLTVQEIYKLKLDAELIVLGSCNTGRGQLIEGEGVMSIARALAYSGCRSTIATLRPIGDASTASILEFFFEEISNKKIKKSKAFQRAKLKYIRNGAPVMKWLDIVLIGDPSPIAL